MQASEEARKKRVEQLREKTGLKLSTLHVSNIDARSISGHIENLIGTVAIPLGIAGPLKIQFTTEQTEDIYAPMATTEGALISSIQRGALAISLSGGVKARVISNRMVRAPQFDFESLDQALDFQEWLNQQEANLKKLVKQKSSYAQLNELQSFIFGRSVHVRFIYSTGNAAGQNMTTFCTAHLCQWLLQNLEYETNIVCTQFLIEGNLSSDKKNSFINQSQGRGRSVVAEALIKKQVLKKIMKLNVDQFVDTFNRSKSARIYSGMTGYNINVANVVAALFAATGQDFACIHESSTAELHVEQKGEDLLMTLVMPTLVVGTVGGGTQLPHARDNLDILGCLGSDGADRLAQIIASYALALDLSTASAIGSGDFVNAHQNLARHLDQKLFKLSEVTPAFFVENFNYFKTQNVKQIKKVLAENKEGHTIDFANHFSKKICGLMAFEVSTDVETVKTFIKIKPVDTEIIQGAAQLMNSINPSLAAILVKNINFLPFKNCHRREIEVLNSIVGSLIAENSPQLLGTLVENQKDIYIIAQKYLDQLSFISEVDDLTVWTSERKSKVLTALLKVHSYFWNKEDSAHTTIPHLLQAFTAQAEESEFWKNWIPLVQNYIYSFQSLSSRYEQSTENISTILTKIQTAPQTLIHYDFNSRNMAFQKDQNNQERAILFDWELASWGPAQRDLIEFVLFTSTEQNVKTDFLSILQDYKLMLEEQLHITIDSQLWIEVGYLCIDEFIVRRLPFYCVMSELGQCHYIHRLLSNLNALIIQDEK